jgi:hypothetical protein
MTKQDIINEYLQPRSGNLQQMIHNFLSLDVNKIIRNKVLDRLRGKERKKIKDIYINSKFFYRGAYYKSLESIISDYNLSRNDIYFIKTVDNVSTLQAIDIIIEDKKTKDDLIRKNNLDSHKYLYKPWVNTNLNTNLYERWFIHEL